MLNETLACDMEKLKEEILKMGRLLEEQLYKAVKSLVEKNLELAQEVIAHDDLIDQMEMDIEKKSLGILALKQPMASDLRLIGTALRIIVDIERMADHAEDIAHLTIALYDQVYIKPLIDIPRMAAIVQKMLEKALNAFVNHDVNLAMSLIPLEEEIDKLYDQIFRELLSYMMQDPKNIPQATSLLLVSGHIERIGDHATNLAEMVVYLVEGKRIDLNRMARKSRLED
ncbi:MAG: phosphate signaling complex protein PhoU [Syntrophomonas sp.]|uniref:phosphate signaling complex protein PhoU n=1 Tax=Syntrophomonas sp. TaxID=2053627 RepID=UPI00260F01AE|nr:phosphate signaling complex protein PhoU [Syntrophomonas sp.]MDD4627553.1 phosphate signaling complex protein PhoU [Syntrophomonas sp.]